MTRTIAPFAATLAVLASASTAQAQSTPRWANDPSDLDAPERTRAAEEKMAERECGNDRRCRIDRLKRSNRARRYAGQLEQERYALSVQRGLDKRRAEKILRLQKPINAEFYASFLGPGLTAGYTFLEGKLRAEGMFSFNDEYISQNVDVGGQSIYLDGDTATFFFGANATWLFNEGWWSPYVTGGAMLGTGQMNTYFFDEFGSSFGERQTEFHIVQAAGGFDVQADFGLRARLGATLRYPIHVQTTQSGAIDRQTREALRSWFTQSKLFGVEFSAGWAF